MMTVLAVVRLLMAAAAMLAGGVVVLVCSLTPGAHRARLRGVRLANWAAAGLAGVLCRIFRVRVLCPSPERLAAAAGLVFPNHLSLLDPLVLMAVAPMRFVSAVEVQRYPVIGWMARGIGTVFIRRSDPDARKAARAEIAVTLSAEPQPPVVLFPEGRLGPGYALFPLRHGAFAVAAADRIPYVLCGLRYRPVEVVIWRGGLGESLWSALWRLARHGGPVQAEVLPLPVQTPAIDADPAQMAAQAQTALASILGLPAEPAIPPPPRMA
jgi:1-acyl-sn-glycerol-3-phosphate acyltransferase